jgi:hypothetical protein
MVAALDGHDAFTVMARMSAAADLLGATDAERKAALGTHHQPSAPTHPYGGAHAAMGASGPRTGALSEPMTFQQQQQMLLQQHQQEKKASRGTKRKADSRNPPGVKFLGKYVRVWWDAPFNNYFVGRVDHYSGEEKKYKVIYNEGTADEEWAFEDLESMKAAYCKIVPPPKTPVGVAGASALGGGASGPLTTFKPLSFEELEKRIKKSKTVYELDVIQGEITEHIDNINQALKFLDEQSDEERDELDDLSDSALPADAGGHEAAPEAPPVMTPEVTPEAPIEAPPQVTPEAPTEAAPEAPPEMMLEAAPEVTLEAVPEVLTEAPTEAAPEVPTEATPTTPFPPVAVRPDESTLAEVTVTPQQSRQEMPPAARSPRTLAIGQEDYVNTVPAPLNEERHAFVTPMIQMLIDAPDRLMYIEPDVGAAAAGGALSSNVDLVAPQENLSDV